MPTLENLTAAELRGPLKAKSLQRARRYTHNVHDPVRKGQTLTAQVKGNRLYDVEIDLSSGDIDAFCTCPYDWGGYCKHIGAVLLKWVHSPENFVTETARPQSGDYPIDVIPVEPLPTHRPEELPYWMTTSFDKLQDENREGLTEWLEEVKLGDLRKMGKARGWRLKGTRKADVIEQLADYFTDPDDARQAIQSLDEEHRLVLRALVLLSLSARVWEDDLEQVAQNWGALKTYKKVDTYTRHLWEKGLALPGYSVDNYTERGDMVPFGICRHFPPFFDGLATDLPADTDASGLRLADPFQLVRAATQVMVLLEGSPVQLRPPMPRPVLERFHKELKGWDYVPQELAQAQRDKQFAYRSGLALTVPPPGRSLPDEAIQRLAPIAGGEPQLEFIYSLLVTTGVFQPGSPTTVWPEMKTSFLRRDELAQRALMTRTYFSMLNWSALWEVLRANESLALKRNWQFGHYQKSQFRHDLYLYRQLVLRTLACLPDDQWISLPALFQMLQPVWPNFDQTAWETYRYSYSHRHEPKSAWFLTSNGEELDPKSSTDWEKGQGRFIQQIIAGPLHWLGLADLYFAGKDLAAFRLHGLADLYWDRVDSPPPPRHAPDRAAAMPSAEAVTADKLSISVVPSAVSGQAHSMLDKIARLEVMEADHFVYQLDARAAYESFEAGAALADILNEWEKLLPIPVPAPILEQLAAWWEAYGRVRIYRNLTVIEFGDDYALTEMKAVTSLEDHLIAEISPRLVIVRQEAVNSLTAQLEKAGYTPKQTDQV